MKATCLTMRRYRAFDREVTVPLSGFTTLTGPNNLGKSTILLALQLFFSAMSRYGLSPMRLYDVENDYPKRYLGRRGRRFPTRVSMRFELSPDDISALRDQAGHVFPTDLTVSLELFQRDRRPEIATQPASPPAAVAVLRQYIGEKVRYVYIPTARGGGESRLQSSVQREIARLAFSKVRNTRRRIQSVERLLEDAREELDAVKNDLALELRRFMPELRAIDFEIVTPDIRQLLNLRDILVDDGAETSLTQKGDGVKNLFSIAVLQYVARQDPGDHLILGIEEPEAHLHSNAIYKLKPELRTLAEQHQVIVTTHSPILVQREEVGRNLIVEQNSQDDGFCSIVRPARSLAEIRACLGIKAQENMTTSEVVILVEGDTECTVCSAFFRNHYSHLADAVDIGRIRILSANGAAKIPAMIRALARDATDCVVLLDADTEGLRAKNDLLASALIAARDIFMVPSRDGCQETEFEDMFEPDTYVTVLNEVWGTELTVEAFEQSRQRSGTRGNRMQKWSHVVERLLQSRGKDWNALRVDTRTSFASAVAQAIPTLNLGNLPCLTDLAGRVTAMLREEDQRRRT